MASFGDGWNHNDFSKYYLFAAWLFFAGRNGLANAFISKNKKNIPIKCKTLIDIIKNEKIKHITNLKIDIEGFEEKVLITFLKKCKKTLIPKNIILEHSMNKELKIGLIKYLLKIGYTEIFRNKSNIILNFQR